MPTAKEIRFQTFRYQILPVSQIFQTNWLEPGVQSLADLIAHKNDFFARAVNSIQHFTYSRTELEHRSLFSEGSKTIYRIGAKRELDRTRRDFTHEPIENWPSVLVVIDNDKDTQSMLIEKNPDAFQLAETVAAIFEKNINVRLAPHHLQCYIEPMFEKSVFWELVHQHENKITCVDFEIITPNMPGISGSLSLDLKNVPKIVNSAKTNLRFESPDNNALTLKEGDAITSGLVNYTSEGGGNITLKVRGFRKKISTKNSTKEISIAEAEITGKSGPEILAAINQLL